MSPDAVFDKALKLDLEICPSDGTFVRRTQMILTHANAESLELGGVYYSSRVDLKDLPDQRAQMDVKAALVAFAGQGYAARDTKDPTVYYLRSGVLDYLRHSLISELEMEEVLGKSKGSVPDLGKAPVPPARLDSGSSPAFATLSPQAEDFVWNQAIAFGDAYNMRSTTSDGGRPGWTG